MQHTRTAAPAGRSSGGLPGPQVGPEGGDAGAPTAPQRAALRRTSAALGVYAFAFAVSFGAVAVGTGLSVAQAVVMSAVLCSGASQFAFVGVLAAGGGPAAAAAAAVLLGLRNALYGPAVRSAVRPTGWRLPVWGMLVIDESAAVTVAEEEPAAARYAFTRSGTSLYAGWVGGTLVGALLGDVLDPVALGLDAIVPVVFVTLLLPRLSSVPARRAAVAAAVVATVVVPVVAPGVPVLVAAVLGTAVGAAAEGGGQ